MCGAGANCKFDWSVTTAIDGTANSTTKVCGGNAYVAHLNGVAGVNRTFQVRNTGAAGDCDITLLVIGAHGNVKQRVGPIPPGNNPNNPGQIVRPLANGDSFQVLCGAGANANCKFVWSVR